MSLRSSLAILVVLAGAFAAAAATPEDPRVEATQAFLASLDETQREEALFGYDDAERLAWNFLPNTYRGVRIGGLDEAQREALGALFDAHVSKLGQERVERVRWLEEVLHERESRPDRPADHRDPDRYWVAVFGAPGAGDWSWRLQGHHLSMNFHHTEDGMTCAPYFVGANPRRAGGAVTSQRAPNKVPFQLLGEEEQWARALLNSLTEEQRKKAVSDGPVPRDILMLPGMDTPPPLEGLPASELGAEQEVWLETLLLRCQRHLHTDPGLASYERMADLDGVHFRWIGSTQPHEAHYWRVQGPEFVLEWCTPQGDAEHVHYVWRDLERGFTSK